ncbi:uncharacterized protein A1O9_02483 [Exophiala aquamarina CBS 119918]|uniref:Clr5 domain-containing protein n=1 Tax=Exophiala aquamarina CBS 119918 TaxID=1182545 RepID=A0A072PLF7_9EURO|nr:uncharacterized protein A1O9_02483 [Exophiala aquamarina CBS 119918]KEF60919.1 hypothetical protein A1O9_02483 [Exophiala aquamarina CBS 119918]
MRDQHGFHAEEHMYKKRLQSWDLRKNYTQEQKLSAYAHIQQHGGVNGDGFLISGKVLIPIPDPTPSSTTRKEIDSCRGKTLRMPCRILLFGITKDKKYLVSFCEYKFQARIMTLARRLQSSADLLDCLPHLRLLAGRMHRDTGEESALLSALSEDVLIMNRLDDAASRDINLVYKLGNLRLSQDRLGEAEELSTEAIALAEQIPEAGEKSVSRVCMWTFSCTGILFAKRGNLVERNRYYKLALERSTSVVQGVLNEADRLRRVRWLEDVVRYYTRKGNLQEVQSLREQYGFLWAELDQEEFGIWDGTRASSWL